MQKTVTGINQPKFHLQAVMLTSTTFKCVAVKNTALNVEHFLRFPIVSGQRVPARGNNWRYNKIQSTSNHERLALLRSSS